MLQKIKTLLGITDTSKDSLLNTLIELVEDDIRNYIHSTTITGLDNVIIQMVVYRYNRLGSEGLDSEDYSGVIFNYSADYPKFLLDQLKRKRKVGVIND